VTLNKRQTKVQPEEGNHFEHETMIAIKEVHDNQTRKEKKLKCTFPSQNFNTVELPIYTL
jgi:hypothetical protein